MRVLIAVLMTVFLGLGTAGNVLANCGTCDKGKAEGKDGCKGGNIPAEIIKKFDKDGDGKLNDEEKAAMKAAHDAKKAEFEKKMLEKFDADKDGKLNDAEKAEMKKFMDEHKGKHHKGEGKGCGEKKGDEKKAEDKSV